MSRNLPKGDRARQREDSRDDASARKDLETIRPQVAKATLQSGAAAANSEQKAQAPARGLRDLAAEAIRTTQGSARAAAGDMAIHEAHLSRLLKDGTLRLEQMEQLGPVFAAKFGQHLVERFGSFASPKAQARRAVREIRRLADELEQLIENEHVA